MQKRLLFLVAVLLTMTLTAMAQITTSSMAGKVTLDDSRRLSRVLPFSLVRPTTLPFSSLRMQTNWQRSL